MTRRGRGRPPHPDILTPADFLRWTGIPLVPDPAPPAPRG